MRMVQTLATMIMSYVLNPSTQDCLLVAKSLHAKFPFMKQDGSEVIFTKYTVRCYPHITYLRRLGSGFCIQESTMSIDQTKNQVRYY